MDYLDLHLYPIYGDQLVGRKLSMEIVSLFWSRYFFAYIEWNDQLERMTPSEAYARVDVLLGPAMREHKESEAGQAHCRIIGAR